MEEVQEWRKKILTSMLFSFISLSLMWCNLILFFLFSCWSKFPEENLQFLSFWEYDFNILRESDTKIDEPSSSEHRSWRLESDTKKEDISITSFYTVKCNILIYYVFYFVNREAGKWCAGLRNRLLAFYIFYFV